MTNEYIEVIKRWRAGEEVSQTELEDNAEAAWLAARAAYVAADDENASAKSAYAATEAAVTAAYAAYAARDAARDAAD